MREGFALRNRMAFHTSAIGQGLHPNCLSALGSGIALEVVPSAGAEQVSWQAYHLVRLLPDGWDGDYAQLGSKYHHEVNEC